MLRADQRENKQCVKILLNIYYTLIIHNLYFYNVMYLIILYNQYTEARHLSINQQSMVNITNQLYVYYNINIERALVTIQYIIIPYIIVYIPTYQSYLLQLLQALSLKGGHRDRGYVPLDIIIYLKIIVSSGNLYRNSKDKE